MESVGIEGRMCMD